MTTRSSADTSRKKQKPKKVRPKKRPVRDIDDDGSAAGGYIKHGTGMTCLDCTL